MAGLRSRHMDAAGGLLSRTMRRCVLLAILSCSLEVLHTPVWGALSGAGGGGGGGRHRFRGVKDKSDPLCTAEWTFSPCIPINNKCGRGYKLGTRVGELCRLLSDLFYCTVDCVEEGGKVHVDALFNRTKRGPYPAEPSDAGAAEPERLTKPQDYSAHVPGSQYVQDGCTYRVGKWQNCSAVHLTKQREDSLVASPSARSAGKCVPRKTVEMDCTLVELEPAKCRYSAGKWSKCDQKTNKRTQLKTLAAGDPAHCSPDMRVQRPCFTKSGEERCFYGQWSEWSPCANNIKIKRRKVLYGQGCDKATRMANCHARATSG